MLVESCISLTRERWSLAIAAIETGCMIINATLFVLKLHKEPFQEHIMLTAFIIELLIIAFSAGAGIGRNRNGRIHFYLNSVGGFYNRARSDSRGRGVAQ